MCQSQKSAAPANYHIDSSCKSGAVTFCVDDSDTATVAVAATTTVAPSVMMAIHQGEICDDVDKSTKLPTDTSATPLFMSSGWDNKNVINNVRFKDKDGDLTPSSNLSALHRHFVPRQGISNLGSLLCAIQGMQVSNSHDKEDHTIAAANSNATANITMKTMVFEERNLRRTQVVKKNIKKHEQQQHSSCEALGNILFPLVSNVVDSDAAPKVTGMLLELKPREVKSLICSKERLESAINQAQTLLKKSVPSPKFNFVSPPTTHAGNDYCI
eukprot:CAMPEP_0185259060 /NCGR_PEP_ID=MMETSP1359-20130426/7906_1 /TAXON_ID=552665 /ORGANISM="Bigelowiella longifila, Strain CCMP242" /LENGTH=270 /DNA_ID=CAMNT_0027844835 /DNA_START=805 /DNA_END=1617 /DNA_ORIENTATION=+